MPDLYCSACKRTTTHKTIMRKNQVESESSIGQLFNSIGQIFRGNHYYEMEAQLFCRECNAQHFNVDSEINRKNLSNTSQISLTR